MCSKICARDDAIFELFGTDPLPSYLRNPGVGGADRTEYLRGYDHTEEVSELLLKIADVQCRLVPADVDEVMFCKDTRSKTSVHSSNSAYKK